MKKNFFSFAFIMFHVIIWEIIWTTNVKCLLSYEDVSLRILSLTWHRFSLERMSKKMWSADYLFSFSEITTHSSTNGFWMAFIHYPHAGNDLSQFMHFWRSIIRSSNLCSLATNSILHKKDILQLLTPGMQEYIFRLIKHTILRWLSILRICCPDNQISPFEMVVEFSNTNWTTICTWYKY